MCRQLTGAGLLYSTQGCVGVCLSDHQGCGKACISMACSCVCVEATSGRCASGPFCVSTRCWVPALGVLHVRCCVQIVMVGRGGGDWGWEEGVLDAYIATHEWWCQMNMVGARECQILCVVLLHQQEAFVCHIPSGCNVWVDWLEERSEIAIRGFGRCSVCRGCQLIHPTRGYSRG